MIRVTTETQQQYHGAVMSGEKQVSESMNNNPHIWGTVTCKQPSV